MFNHPHGEESSPKCMIWIIPAAVCDDLWWLSISHAVPFVLGLCFSVSMSTAIPPDPWGSTALCTALTHWYYRGSYKSGGFNSVTACLKKLLAFLFTKDKWTSEIQRKRKTGLSFCDEKSTRCKKSQWSLLNSTAACAAAWQWVRRQPPERVVRLPENCCTVLLDTLETVLYLVSNTGPPERVMVCSEQIRSNLQ